MGIITEILKREFTYLWYYFDIQFRQIFVFWIVGIILGSLISVFAKDRINNLFSSMSSLKWGIFSIIPASLLGIASPLCMYGTIPIAASFANKGMREDWLAAFMMSSILLNPQLIIYSMALGTQVLLLRIVSCIICGILTGLLVRIFYKNKKFFRFDGFLEKHNRDTDKNLLLRLIKNILRNIKATGVYFLLGIVISCLFQRYVPTEAFVSFFGNNSGLGVLMAATLGVPLYVCGGGTIPILQLWLHRGMSLGSATAFMIAGPSTKITNLSALKIVFGFKRFILYIVYILAFSFLSGLFVDLIM